MFVTVLLELVGSALAITNMIIMWTSYPWRLGTGIACVNMVMDQGSLLASLSVLEILMQVVLETGNLVYFFVIIDRYSTFGMFIPGGNSRVVRKRIVAISVFFYILTFVQLFVVNVGISPSDILTIHHPRCITAFMFQLGFVDVVGALDLTVAYYLCGTAFSVDKQWMILSLPSDVSVTKSENGAEATQHVTTGFGIPSNRSSRRIPRDSELSPPFTINELSDDLKLSPEVIEADDPQEDPPSLWASLLSQVLSNKSCRRVAVLLLLSLSVDSFALILCILPLAVDELANSKRAFELIAVHLVLLHIISSLWFLESFKEVVLNKPRKNLVVSSDG
ncbi:hypothetical protein BJ742DRAFT_850385 [Cladochytrium replicatum]|nr:hypothetical protein BJ742DRAFT_850385 [Cladochytrium replicatum]